ncbi:hypothetical protein NQ314_007404, partial [Rhamnusium bicolor]
LPFKRPQILVLWVKAVRGGENWSPSKMSRLCWGTFISVGLLKFRLRCNTKLLKLDAVPSLTLELVLGQKTDSEIKDHGQRRYSALMKQFANTLFMFRVQ